MIVFGIGQRIAFAVEDEADALEFGDHDRRINAMQCVACFRGRPADGLMIDDAQDTVVVVRYRGVEKTLISRQSRIEL